MKTTLLNDSFLLLTELGHGAAGTVYKAALTKDAPYAAKGSHVAIKIFNPWVLQERGHAQRIERELRVSCSVHSPHLVRTHAVGTDGDFVFLVMQLLEGPTLTQWMKSTPQPAFDIFIGLAKCLFGALAALHEHEVIHRDVKPDNIIMTSNGAVLMDLGVIKPLATDSDITFSGSTQKCVPELK